MSRADRKSQVRQSLGFCAADFWSSLAYESAEQKPKHCLTPGFLIPLSDVKPGAEHFPLPAREIVVDLLVHGDLDGHRLWAIV